MIKRTLTLQDFYGLTLSTEDITDNPLTDSEILSAEIEQTVYLCQRYANRVRGERAKYRQPKRCYATVTTILATGELLSFACLYNNTRH